MSTSPPSFVNTAERLKAQAEVFYSVVRQALADLRVAIPAVVQSFDATRQVVTVQPAIKERMNQNLVPTDVALPLLQDVPVVFPRAGGFVLTFPILPGDECLLVFADMCIDSWWQSGGTENVRAAKFRHDVGDAIAVFGLWSQPRKLANYSTTSVQLRNEDGTKKIEITSSGIKLTADDEIDITAPTVKINGTTVVDISGDNTKVDGKVFLTHKHSGVQTGGGQTGNVV